MTAIRFQVPERYMSSLKGKLGLATDLDVVQEALTILAWAADEKERGRLILSTNKDGGDIKRLAMRSLEPRA